MKVSVLTFIGAIGGALTSLFGGWDASLVTLIVFMAIDYVTGIVVGGVFHKSPKTKSGALESKAGWKGLCRKGMTILIILISCRLDLIMGTSFVRDAVIIAYIVNETISIVENAGLMGLPVPTVVTEAIEVLKKKEEKTNGNN